MFAHVCPEKFSNKELFLPIPHSFISSLVSI